MDNPGEMGGESITPEEAMQQLVEMRMQLGKERFVSIAQQMGMPGELLEYVEEAVTEIGGSGPAKSSGLYASTATPWLTHASCNSRRYSNGLN